VFRSGVVVLQLTLVLAVAACAPARQRSATSAADLVAVQILAINDLHGHLEPPPGSNGRINAVEAGGAAYLATHLRHAIARQPNTIVVAAGDLIGASPLVSSIFHDEPIVEALNVMPLTLAAVGNHELDEGLDELLRVKRGGCHPTDGCQDGDGYSGASFEYLAANIVRRSDGSTLFPGVAIRTIGGVKIGFIGMATVETAQIVPPAIGRAVQFGDEADSANQHAAALTRQGVRAIVLLIHEGLRQSAPATDPNGCIAPDGRLKDVVKRLSPDIQVVISGHSHAYYNCRMGAQLVTSASSYGRMFTRIALEIDPANGRIASANARNEIVTRDVGADPAVSAIIRKYAPLIDKIANQQVGSIMGDLTSAANEAGESVLGSIIADAQLAATRSTANGGAVIAFMNTGGIRADIVAGPQTWAGQPQPVTYRELHSIQPFGNTLMTMTMTGDMIRRLLEQQFDNPTPGAQQILQVSQGFTYRYRAAARPGQRVDAASLRLDDRPVAPSDRVRVTTSDFLLNGGDGFSVFGESTDRQAAVGDLEALAAYFKSKSPIVAPPRDRIARTN
jgi:5'-nucleotidase